MNQKTKSRHSSPPLNQKQHQSNRQTRTTPAPKKSGVGLLSFNKSSKHKKTRKKSATSHKLKNPDRTSPNTSVTAKNHQIPQQRKHKRPSKKLVELIPFPVKILLNLLVITMGVSTILGSAISIANSLNTEVATQVPVIPENTTDNQQQLEKRFSVVTLGQELSELKAKLQNVTAQYSSKLQTQVFIVDLAQKDYVSIQGTNSIAAASTIKLPILVAFFQDVDAGKIDLEEKLTMTKELKAGGSGGMQYQATGTRYSALYTATQMMVTSDNSATNMIIQRLGGQDKLNQRFADWGLNVTAIRNPLPDLSGTNTTSSEDLAKLLLKIERGELISFTSRDRLLRIMNRVRTNTLLPEGLEKGATIAHKTGDIGSVLGDVGIIDMPNGKRYVAAVFVQRPKNDPQAKPLIQKISRTTYQYFKIKPPQSFLEEN